MMGAWRALRRFWESDPGLSVFLGLLVVFLFVLPPSSRGRNRTEPGRRLGPLRAPPRGSGGSSPRIAAVRAVLFVLVVAALVVRWGPFSAAGHGGGGPGDGGGDGLRGAGPGLSRGARQRPPHPGGRGRLPAARARLGAGLRDRWPSSRPGRSPPRSPAEPERGRFIYFSFVTLSTLGYGDVTPVHPVARSLAVAEALTGQLYPAILLGRLVSLATSRGPGGPGQEAPPAGPGRG